MMANQGGRPSYYDIRYADVIVEHLALGHSRTAAAAAAGIPLSTLVFWEKEHPEFRERIEFGKQLSALAWEKKLLRNAESGEGNHQSISLGLRNRCKAEWVDAAKLEHTGPDGGPMVQEVIFRVIDPKAPDASGD